MKAKKTMKMIIRITIIMIKKKHIINFNDINFNNVDFNEIDFNDIDFNDINSAIFRLIKTLEIHF
jgi:hypothetical protein